MNMKKLISLGVVSAMVASLSTAAFATQKKAVDNLDGIKVYALNGDSTNTRNLSPLTIENNKSFNGGTFNNAIVISGKNSDTKKIVFGLSQTCIFGKATSKPANQEIVEAKSGTNGIKVAKDGTFTNASGLTAKAVTNMKINSGSGDYSGAYGVNIAFTNSATSDKYAAYTITLTDVEGHTKNITLLMSSTGLDKDDTSDAEVDADESGIKEFSSGASLKNGYAIFPATLKEMVGKGQYKFVGTNGVNVLSSVSQATVNAGKTEYKTELTVDSNLSARYDKEGTGKVMKLCCPFLSLETRKINIDCEHQKVIDLLGTDFCDKISNGNIKRLYVYPIHQEGLDSLAKASGNDGLINTDEVISATVSDSKIAFTLPKDMTDVMISLKELDTTKLTAIPGVSIPESTTPANEVVAPVGTEDVTSVVAPSVVAPSVSAPVLDRAPVATNGTQQDTGASDVVVVAIALAAISMVGAGVFASKKF